MPPLPDQGGRSAFSLLEDAPSWLVEAPLYAYALWLAARHRGLTLPTIVNPSILIGGIAGESKTDLYHLAGPAARAHFAPFITITPATPAGEIAERLAAAGLAYPVVAKPDIGLNGRGVKIVRSPEELARHLALFPREARVLLQRYVAEEGEAGIFYVRHPSEAAGRITSLTLKYFPRVVGDGRSTLRELIERDPRLAKRAAIYLRRNKGRLDEVVPAGEARRIVSVGNHVRGAVFADGAAHVTPAMTAAFDTIAQDIEGFHFGRFDVRFGDLAALARGEGFTIIEYNGASSEPTHVRDPRTPAWKVWRDSMRHWRYAFEIGAALRALGARPASVRDVWRILQAEKALVAQYPDEE
ncbi:MAG: ATP-grasp domain-containing protein [Patescibacteria group bacterium]|nr:ATP-grasp domain-containing protein [Patescibacteria group bacterium]MDE1944375.1 ATP-grasp domain-containing protein [Patescibacteria group bacterium]MDE1944992.1 ATP-grasp domain-containing protein [Patescibacteria group bacterium]MDE2057472.1 ATP-grasp domain-containing protein [Patescibacteria group bacterium]